MSTSKEELYASIISLFLVPFLMFLNAYAIQIMWLWFMTPFGLPAITKLHAFGIDLLFTHICPTVGTKEGKALSLLGRSFMKTFSILGFAYLAHHFM